MLDKLDKLDKLDTRWLDNHCFSAMSPEMDVAFLKG
jgi:hypothetical protein